MDNVEIFSAGLVADAATEEWSHNLAVVSYCSSCFAVTSRQPAFVWDLADIQSCVADNLKRKMENILIIVEE